MSFQKHLAAEIELTKAEIDSLKAQLKKAQRKHRELSRFLSELVNRTDNEKDLVNESSEV